MSCSGLLEPSTRTSLGITSGGGGGGGGIVDVDAREEVGLNYAVALQPLWTPIGPFSVAYTPPSDGKIIVNVSAQGVSTVGSLYTLTLFINGLEVATLVRGLMWGTATNNAPVNLSFSYPFSVVSGVPQTIVLNGQHEVAAGDGIYNVSWNVLFCPLPT